MHRPHRRDSVRPRRLNSYALLLTAIFFLLISLGLANLYSASSLELHYFYAQLRHTLVGIGVFALFAWVIPFRHINTYTYPFFGLILFLLVLVLLSGHTAGGSQRWILLGPLRVQPSEFAKIATLLCLAKFFYLHRSVTSFPLKGLLPILAALALTFGLIFKQPDFGTAGICLLIALVQLSFIRIRMGIRTILALSLGGLGLAFVGWHFLLHPYQKLRILNLVNPNMDPSGSGYNSIQSLVAIGSGRQFGKGFLQGTQTQLQFLPARHTDFIFSVFAEEHGFWGASLLFFLFALVTYMALEIAYEAKDSFGALTAIGLAAFMFIEFSLNVAMVLGLFPVVGMPLPFFSYGGSALVTVCMAMGLLVGIHRERTPV